jgi:CheY-like chemotaxis protein/HPt (histidine-containing phosphotransfer) domain-containing protein
VVATRSVLYIEDNPTNVLLVERIMASRPAVQLLVATTGEAGFELAVARRPHLILLDLHLPDVGGEVLLARIRDEPVTAKTPVVVVSADAMTENVTRVRAAGATDYLTKPFDLREFLAVIDAVLAAPDDSEATLGRDDQIAALDDEVIAQLRRLADAGGALGEVLGAYESDAVAGLDRISQALGAGDRAAVAAIAHRLRGSSASLGARRLAQLLATLEDNAAALTTAEAAQFLPRISEELGRTTAALRQACHLSA